MKTTWWKWVMLLIFGISAPLWWTWSISKLVYAIYVASGSPEKPTTSLLWRTVYIPQFFLGVTVGLTVTAFSAPHWIKGWFLFIGALISATVVNGVMLGSTFEPLRLTFTSIGSLFFIAGTALIPVFFAFRNANVLPPHL